MILKESYTLNNGVKIPKIGLGTWMIEDDVVATAVQEAIKLGYRHIDTAQGYGNERGVGEGICMSGVPREELFVTTKIEADYKTYQEAAESICVSLKKMDIEYIDMIIIHSPQPWDDFREENHYFTENLEVWRALEEAYDAGKIRAIGVSNFLEIDLENLLTNARIKPMVNQILCHVANTPFSLIEYCRAHDILVEAYSPIAHGEMMKNEQVVAMAKKYNVTVAQLGIRYCLELGALPLPKTANPSHMANNADVDFKISTEDMEILKNAEPIKNYGDSSLFPVYGGKRQEDGTLIPRDFETIKKD